MKDKQAKDHYITISPDLDYYYQDEEGMCGGYSDDVIENNDRIIQPIFSIVLPGISEWSRRYEDKTDFANTETDPSFDWKRWHRDGLLFAKELYRQLPRSYNLLYDPPFEDKSGTLSTVDFSKDDVEAIIKSLGDHPYLPDARPSYKYNVAFQISDEEKDTLAITMTVGNYTHTLRAHRPKIFNYLRMWMERVVLDEEDVIQAVCFFGDTWAIQMMPQRIGQFTQMGQLRVVDHNEEELFSAYVERREFIRGLYLSLLNHLGFLIFTTEEFRAAKYPEGEELVKRWQPYNDLRSDIIEWYITDDLFYNSPIPADTGSRLVNETVVIFSDWGCCMWDTMGCGCGDEGGLSLDSGEYDMDIPGFKEWNARWGDPDINAPDYESWWQEGWRIAKEIRKRLPSSIDLYYMCFDPAKPDAHPDYKARLPKIIVPLQQQ